MCDFEARCGDFISPPARTATCGKVATSESVTKDAGGGIPRAPIASGRKTSYGVPEMAMNIRVKLFATLSRYPGNGAPGVPFEIELSDGTTLADLVDRLKLPHEEVKVFFVNGRARPADWPLEAGDEVGIFPLVAGG